MNWSTPPTPMPSLRDSRFGASPVLVPALVGDMARMFRQLGVESLRASVVDMDSMAFLAAWTITDNGEVSDHSPDRPLDSQFPGAMATITQLASAPAEQTVVQRLSPRRWSFAWRIDSLHVVIAEARYRDMRATVSQTDTALVRLVCDTGIRTGQSGNPEAAHAVSGSLVWPGGQDRRQQPRSPLANLLSLGLMAATCALALWLGLVALPDARDATAATQVQATKLRGIADSTMVRALSQAMATGDYGEVQTELSSFESLGYFQSAAVVNARQRVVSLSSGTDGLRMGNEVPATVAASARRLDLALGSERYGQLLVLAAPSTEPVENLFGPLRLGALAVAAGAAGAALLTLVRQRKSRRIGD